MAQPLLNVTELDFDQIKANLKSYFQRQDSPISDWNYDGSGLNMLLDVLAYNTHYNAILAHLNLNESFIDTAQLRSSVISQAKLLGYIPRSITAAAAQVTVAFSASGSPTASSALIVPRGTKFTGSSPNGSFTFTTTQDSNQVFYNTVSGYYSASLSIIQGVSRSQSYQVDNSVPNQKFVLDDPSADFSQLSVLVYPTINNANYAVYVSINAYTALNGGDLANVNGSSQVYFPSMNSQGKYEVTFGDGVLGKSLSNLNVVQLSYISTEGSIANGVTTFEFADTIVDSNSNPVSSAIVTTLGNSSGGSEEESTDAIRQNAPASLISQNRAVTANDYITLLKDHYPAITSINVWGGEDEVAYDPINAAQYAGRVFICFVGSGISGSDVINYLKAYKVMSVTNQIYNPDYINIYLNVNFKYNANLTNKSVTDLQNLISSMSGGVISNYNASALQSFTGVFRNSVLLRLIDASDPAILNSDMQVSFYKNYTINPITTASNAATIGIGALPNGLVTTFGNKLYGSVDQTLPMITSQGFGLTSASMQTLMPSNQPITVYGTYSSNSTTVYVYSSPGTSTSTNGLTNPYLVVGAVLTSSTTGFTSSTVSISSINNTGTQSIITLSTSASVTLATTSAVLYITPPSGTYYLKDADDPASTSSRRLFMSLNSSATVAVSDPKYSSSGTDILVGTVYPSTGKLELYRYFTGTVTATTTQSLTDSVVTGTSAWYTNQFTGCVMYITGGTGYGTSRAITTNSSNTLYWTDSLTLDTTSQYMVIRTAIDVTTSSTIRIYSRPASDDIAPSRHQLLSISSDLVTVTGVADTFAQSGVLGASNYTTFSRDP